MRMLSLNTVQYKHTSQTLYVWYCWTPYNINTHLKHYTYVMLNTVQYKQTSQTLCVCYVEHLTMQTHISNNIRMLCWTPYNINTHLKHYAYVMLNTLQYKHTSQTLCVCYCWTPYNINTHLKHYTYVMLNTVQYKHTSQTLCVCYVEHLTMQTHISNTIRMLCWTPYNINTHLKHYAYVMLNTLQYKHTSQTLCVCYVEHRTI